MNAAEQEALGRALAASGIRMQRSLVQGGNVVGWEDVAPAHVIGQLAKRGWSVTLGEKREAPPPALNDLTPGIVPTSALVTWSCSAGHGGVLDERSSFALRASGSSAFIAPCPECGERICARL